MKIILYWFRYLPWSLPERNRQWWNKRTPYIIIGNKRDNYPLMKLFPWHAHDIALTRLATSKTVVDEGSAAKA